MNSSRLVRIPIDHLVAEVAAFPLASEPAFQLGLPGLDPDDSPGTAGLRGSDLGQRTAQLWRQAEQRLLGGFPAFSVDEVVAIRDAVWFHRSPSVSSASEVHPLHIYLRGLARRFLVRR